MISNIGDETKGSASVHIGRSFLFLCVFENSTIDAACHGTFLSHGSPYLRDRRSETGNRDGGKTRIPGDFYRSETGGRIVEGYKAFDGNLMCRGMQYEVGKEYVMEEEPVICQRGFHFCKNLADCYMFYPRSDDTRICEIEASGEITTDEGGIKYCTNRIRVVKEIENPRVRTNVSESSTGYCNVGHKNSGNWNSGACNRGDWNSGYGNSGDRNSGDDNSGNGNSGKGNSGCGNSGNRNSGDDNSGNGNSGDGNSGACNSGYWNSGDCNCGDGNSGKWNIGDRNSGDWNSGDGNSGYRNSGDSNSGDDNSGDCNSGDRNSGDRNSGDWNCGNWNSGVFNTDKSPKIKMFDRESEWTMTDWEQSAANIIMSSCPKRRVIYVPESQMTDEEKDSRPEYKNYGGYTGAVFETSEEKQKWWDALSEEDKDIIYKLPNFDAEKFEKCVGIHLKASGNEED